MKISKLTLISLAIVIGALTNTIFYLYSTLLGFNGIAVNFLGGADDSFFYWQQIQNILSDLPWIKTSIYPYFISRIILLLGINNVIVVRIINLFAYVFLVLVIIRIYEILMEDNIKPKYSYLLLIILYPSMLVYVHMSILRDVWIYLIYFIAILEFFDFQTKKRRKDLLLLFLLIYIIALFRTYAALSFLIAMFLSHLSLFIKKKRTIYLLVASILIITIFSFYYLSDVVFPIVNLSFENALIYRDSYTLSNSNSLMNISLNVDNYFVFILQFIKSLIGNFLGPLFFRFINFKDYIIVLFESIVMIVVVSFIWFYRGLISKKSKILLIHSTVWLMLISVTNDNIGTATRLRVISYILIYLVFVQVISFAYNKKSGDEMINQLNSHNVSLSVIGLGYVGLPIAVSFATKVNVIGFDISKRKIDLYKKGIDPTNEVGNDVLRNSNVFFTNDETELKKALFHIISVPTPVNIDHTPDLEPIKSAAAIVGRNLTNGSIVVFESTVYPGVTEEICIPILEQNSGLKCGIDFKVGYSPERINPGDKNHRLENIVKVVSGCDDESLSIIEKVYSMVIQAGVYKAESIKIAEAAKVIENSQRDINIAFMNELSIIFEKMGIDTQSVLNAAGTKWNFLKFSPGLVGGHCIGVDPYYLTYKAEQLGYKSQIILSGRRINDQMSNHIVHSLLKILVNNDISIKGSKVGIFGFTFKENCPDIRNTKVFDIYKELKEFGVEVFVYDPNANGIEVEHEYNVSLIDFNDIMDLDALIVAVAHNEFSNFSPDLIKSLYNQLNSKKILFDLKSIYDKSSFKSDFIYWRL